MTNYLDLQPGTIWMLKKNHPNSPTLIVKIEQAPYSRINPSYGELEGGFHVKEPPYEGAPVVKMYRGSRMPQIAYRYLICSDQKYLNKVTSSHANGFTYYYQRIH